MNVRAMVLALVLAVAASREARADGAHAGCDARLRGERAFVGVQLDGFFDKELLKLVRLGLEGRVELEVKLVRKRSFWFDKEVVSVPRHLVVTFDKAHNVYVIDHARVLPDPAHLSLERLSLPLPSEGSRDNLEAQITARLQVVTVSSLGRVATWIAGGAPDDAGKEGKGDGAPSRSALTRSLLATLTDDLTRIAEARCAAKG